MIYELQFVKCSTNMYCFCTRKTQQEDTEYTLDISVTYCCGKLTQPTSNNLAILDYTIISGQWSNVTGFIWQRIRREVGDAGAGRQMGRPKQEPVREEKRGKTNRGKTQQTACRFKDGKLLCMTVAIKVRLLIIDLMEKHHSREWFFLSFSHNSIQHNWAKLIFLLDWKLFTFPFSSKFAEWIWPYQPL